MASVRKDPRNPKRWQVRYRDPSGQERTKGGFDRKADADLYAATVEVDTNRGLWIDPALGKSTLAEQIERWKPTVEAKRESTRVRDLGYVKRYIEPRLGRYPLTAVDYETAQAWVTAMEAKVAPATVVKAAQLFSSIMQMAVNAKRIPSNPFADVALPKLAKREVTILTPEEIAAVADAIDQRYRAMALVMFFCGTRIGETVALRWKQVDLLHRQLRVVNNAPCVEGRVVEGEPKTAAGFRTVGFPSAIRDELEAHRDSGWSGPELVFVSPDGTIVNSGNWRRRVWAPAIAKAGVPRIGPHGARHTAVSMWIAAGYTPEEVKQWAGHESIVTIFDLYGHLWKTNQGERADKLDQFVVPSSRLASVEPLHGRGR